MGRQLKKIIWTLTILMKGCPFRDLPLPPHPEAPAKTRPQEQPREPAEISQQQKYVQPDYSASFFVGL